MDIDVGDVIVPNGDTLRKRYERGIVFQIEFETGYGYIQEAGEISLNGNKEYYAIVYAQPSDKELKDPKKLSSENYFIAHFEEKPSDILKKPIDNNSSMIGNPIRKTSRGFEFKYGINSSIYIKSLRDCPVSNTIKLPEYFRKDEYDFVAGTYKWIVMKPFYNYIRQQKTVVGIEQLPPYHIGFGFCVGWWEEGTTLETWNDEYCKRVIKQHYEDFPEDCPMNMSFDEIISTIPTKKWIENESDDVRKRWYSDIETILQHFITTLSPDKKIPLRDAKKAVKGLCTELNNMQSEEFFFETDEREEMFTFISNLLRVKKLDSAIDVLDECRDW